MSKRKKNLINLLITQLIIFPIQIYLLLDFVKKYLTYFNYRDFMISVYKLINERGLDKKYKNIFEDVFGHYSIDINNPGFAKGFINILLYMIQYTIIGFSILAFLINIISFFTNKRLNVTSIGIFTYILIFLTCEIVDVFGQKTKLNLNDDEISLFANLNIEKNLKEVSNRVKYLKIYSVLLLLIDFIHIAITIIICIIIKPYKYVVIPKEQNHSIDVNMELGKMKNEDHENNEKDSLINNY